VGFAVETDNPEGHALEKMKKKNLDAIVVNPAETMGSDDYRGILLTKNGIREEIKALTKEEASFKITQRVTEIFGNL
jgi:phosphopantothenoylcysteine synthetase/decarboxylase